MAEGLNTGILKQNSNQGSGRDLDQGGQGVRVELGLEEQRAGEGLRPWIQWFRVGIGPGAQGVRAAFRPGFRGFRGSGVGAGLGPWSQRESAGLGPNPTGCKSNVSSPRQPACKPTIWGISWEVARKETRAWGRERKKLPLPRAFLRDEGMKWRACAQATSYIN